MQLFRTIGNFDMIIATSPNEALSVTDDVAAVFRAVAVRYMRLNWSQMWCLQLLLIILLNVEFLIENIGFTKQTSWYRGEESLLIDVVSWQSRRKALQLGPHATNASTHTVLCDWMKSCKRQTTDYIEYCEMRHINSHGKLCNTQRNHYSLQILSQLALQKQ